MRPWITTSKLKWCGNLPEGDEWRWTAGSTAFEDCLCGERYCDILEGDDAWLDDNSHPYRSLVRAGCVGRFATVHAVILGLYACQHPTNTRSLIYHRLMGSRGGAPAAQSLREKLIY